MGCCKIPEREQANVTMLGEREHSRHTTAAAAAAQGGGQQRGQQQRAKHLSERHRHPTPRPRERASFTTEDTHTHTRARAIQMSRYRVERAARRGEAYVVALGDGPEPDWPSEPRTPTPTHSLPGQPSGVGQSIGRSIDRSVGRAHRNTHTASQARAQGKGREEGRPAERETPDHKLLLFPSLSFHIYLNFFFLGFLVFGC